MNLWNDTYTSIWSNKDLEFLRGDRMKFFDYWNDKHKDENNESITRIECLKCVLMQHTSHWHSNR